MAVPNGTGVWNLGGYTLTVLMDGYDPDHYHPIDVTA
jgi:hypothetical protein